MEHPTTDTDTGADVGADMGADVGADVSDVETVVRAEPMRKHHKINQREQQQQQQQHSQKVKTTVCGTCIVFLRWCGGQ